MGDKLGLGSILDNVRSGNTMYDTMYNTDNGISTAGSDFVSPVENYFNDDLMKVDGLASYVDSNKIGLDNSSMLDQLGLGNLKDLNMKDLKTGVGIAGDVYGLYSSILGDESDKFDLQMDLMGLKKDTLKQNLANNKELINNRRKFHSQWGNTPKASTGTTVS